MNISLYFAELYILFFLSLEMLTFKWTNAIALNTKGACPCRTCLLKSLHGKNCAATKKSKRRKTNHNYNAQLTNLPLARWISWVQASDNSYRGKMILVPHRPWAPRHQEVDTGHPDPRDSHRVKERNTLSLWLYGRRIGFSLCNKENMQHSGADVYRVSAWLLQR